MGTGTFRNPRCRNYEFCLDVAALVDRKEFFCDGCPYQHDTAGQLWDLDDLAGCIALLLAVSSGMTIGMNIRATTEAIASRLLEFVAMITGDRVFDNDSYELIE